MIPYDEYDGDAENALFVAFLWTEELFDPEILETDESIGYNSLLECAEHLNAVKAQLQVEEKESCLAEGNEEGYCDYLAANVESEEVNMS